MAVQLAPLLSLSFLKGRVIHLFLLLIALVPAAAAESFFGDHLVVGGAVIGPHLGIGYHNLTGNSNINLNVGWKWFAGREFGASFTDTGPSFILYPTLFRLKAIPANNDGIVLAIVMPHWAWSALILVLFEGLFLIGRRMYHRRSQHRFEIARPSMVGIGPPPSVR